MNEETKLWSRSCPGQRPVAFASLRSRYLPASFVAPRRQPCARGMCVSRFCVCGSGNMRFNAQWRVAFAGESTAASRVASPQHEKNKRRTQSLQYLNLGGRTNMRLVRHMHSVGMLALVAGMPLTYTVRDCGGPGAVRCMTLASFQARCRRLGTNTAARSATSCRPPEATICLCAVSVVQLAREPHHSTPSTLPPVPLLVCQSAHHSPSA